MSSAHLNSAGTLSNNLILLPFQKLAYNLPLIHFCNFQLPAAITFRSSLLIIRNLLSYIPSGGVLNYELNLMFLVILLWHSVLISCCVISDDAWRRFIYVVYLVILWLAACQDISHLFFCNKFLSVVNYFVFWFWSLIFGDYWGSKLLQVLLLNYGCNICILLCRSRTHVAVIVICCVVISFMCSWCSCDTCLGYYLHTCVVYVFVNSNQE